MKMSGETMNDDISVLVSEAKIRRKLTDEDLGKEIAMKKTSIQNSRSNHTFANLPFWKVVKIAKLAGYEVLIERKGG